MRTAHFETFDYHINVHEVIVPTSREIESEKANDLLMQCLCRVPDADIEIVEPLIIQMVCRLHRAMYLRSDLDRLTTDIMKLNRGVYKYSKHFSTILSWSDQEFREKISDALDFNHVVKRAIETQKVCTAHHIGNMKLAKQLVKAAKLYIQVHNALGGEKMKLLKVGK